MRSPPFKKSKAKVSPVKSFARSGRSCLTTRKTLVAPMDRLPCSLMFMPTKNFAKTSPKGIAPIKYAHK